MRCSKKILDPFPPPTLRPDLLQLEERPGRPREYWNAKNENYSTPTLHLPLSPELVPFENRGSMIDLGGHRGAKLGGFYQPVYEEGVWFM